MLDLLEDPWAIRPSVLRSFLAWVDAGAIPLTALAGEPRPSGTQQTGDTAVIPISGPITRRATVLSFLCGGASTEEISAQLRAAINDPKVSRVVLQVDSPGGTVDGITELAAEIYAARAQKPISAVVDTTAASAAYWLASQANDITVTPSGSVGSIGVFGLHMDRSGQMEQAGIVPTFVFAGKYKTEGNPYAPLGDEARAEMQRRVDAFHETFVNDVARGRGVTADVVRSTFGEGRMVLANDAVARGMADSVAPLATAPASPLASSTRASVDRRALLAIAHANAARIQNALGGN